MKYIRQIVLLFFVLISIRSEGKTNQLELNKVYELTLNSNQSLLYQITIPNSWSKNQNLYITGYSPINDPFQQPILFIKSGDYFQTCQDQSSNLNQVCFIPSKQLSSGIKITVDARCRADCDARLVAYLSEVVEIDLNQQVNIQTKSSPIQKNLRIFIPQEFVFNEVFLFVRILNSFNLKQGVQMYMNVDSNTQFPSKQKHTNVPLVSWGGDKAFILKKGVDIEPGDFINLVLIIPPQSLILFQSRSIVNGRKQIELNQPVYGYIDSTTSNHLYRIDVSNVNIQKLQLPIIISFLEFSGSPNIEVSLSPQFKKQKMVKKSNYTYIRFYITPEMMKSPQFNKEIYVRVSSQSGATYYIYSMMKKASNNNVILGVTQFLDIEKNKIKALTYRHNQLFTNSSEQKYIQIKIQTQGEVEAEIRVFQCIQDNTFLCSIQDNQNISQLSQKYKQLEVINARQIKTVAYSKNYCVNSKNNSSLFNYYGCTTMIVIAPRENRAGQYAVTIKGQQMVQTLSEGQSKYEYVMKSEYKFFTFYLSSSSAQTTELFIYLNIIDGNAKILASSEVVNPTLKDINNSTVKVGVNNVTFKNPTNGVYFLTVFGVQYSDFVIIVIIRRVKNTFGMGYSLRPNQQFSQATKITDIEMKDGLSNTFVIQKGYKQLRFRLKATGNSNLTLTVTELVGKVQTFYTRQSTHKRQKCQKNTCAFQGGKGETFFVEVTGDAKTIRKFSIVYRQISVCYRYPIGTPLYVSLQQNDVECIQFITNVLSPIQISNSLTSLQILDKVVQIFVQFQSNQTFVMSQSSHIFEKQELSKFCREKKPCIIRLKARSFQNPVFFETVIQRLDGVITIYDGVIQRVNQVMTKTQGKFLRYPLQQQQSVQIFLVSQSSSKYTILAKIAEHTDSLQIKTYPKIDSNRENNNGVWGIDSSQDSPSLTILHINKKKIKKYIQESKIKNPWLLITVLGNDQQPQNVIFTLQITQKERTLKQGQQHTGYIEANQIVTYEVYPDTRSLLSIRALQRNKCFKFLDENKKRLENDIVIEASNSIPRTYYVESLNYQNCMYQISLQNFQNSIMTITQGFPTGVELQYSQVTYFLYFHNRNASLKIYEFIQVGSSELYATPLSNFKIQDGVSQILDEIDLNKFKHRTNLINNIEVEAQLNSSSYCYNCYYLIAIKGTPSVKQDIIVAAEGVAVFIKQHSIVDSYLDPQQNQTFIYYSSYVSNFNISLDVVYGRIAVTVTSYRQGSKGKIQRIQGVQKSTILLPITAITTINTQNMGDSIPTNFIDEKIKYKIEIQGVKTASYHLQIIKNSQAFRISQGIASRVRIPAMGSIMLQFQSLLDRDQITLNIETKIFFNNHLSASVYFYQSGFTFNDKKLIDYKQDTIGKVLTVSFPSMKGHYVVLVSNPLNSQYQFIALMPRPGLTELRQFQNIFSQQQTIYQIYIQENYYAIIEAYSCQGNIKIRGSSEITDILGGKPHQKQIQLLHQNFGNHFVISTPINVSGQFFIRVQNKQYAAHINSKAGGIQYMISYRLQSKTLINPYYLLDAPDFRIGIRKGEKRQNISLYIKNVQALNSSIKVRQILYIFIVGISQENIQKFLFCRTQNKKFNSLIYTKMVTGTQKQTQLNISKLQLIKKFKEKGQSYVSGIGITMIEYENGQIYDSILFIYEPSYLLELKSELLITTIGFFQIMVIISAIIGGSVVIYSLIVHLFKLRLGYFNQNQLVEQQSTNKVGIKSDQFQISKTKQQKQKEDKSEQELK